MPEPPLGPPAEMDCPRCAGEGDLYFEPGAELRAEECSLCCGVVTRESGNRWIRVRKSVE